MESSLCEKPERHASRRLSDHLTSEGQKQKVHSLVDKVYARKNLHLAWERVRANRGASGTDRITIEEFEANLEANLERLHRELRDDTYQPLPVRRLEIPKRGAPGKTRPLGIPSIYDRVCQQALANRLEPIFEKVFDPSSFGYRKGRKTADALTKIWREIQAGNEWIVDADLKDYFGSVDHDKLLTLVGKQIADSRVLKLIQQTLNREKTRIVHIAQGFEFLGFKIQRGKGQFKLAHDRIKSKLNRQNLYAIPTQKSVDRFKDQIRALTKRRIPLRLGALINAINPIIRGWGHYYCRSQVRTRFRQLDGWIVRRLWSHCAKRWRNAGWKKYPTPRLRAEFKLVGLVSLIPSLQITKAHS